MAPHLILTDSSKIVFDETQALFLDIDDDLAPLAFLMVARGMRTLLCAFEVLPRGTRLPDSLL